MTSTPEARANFSKAAHSIFISHQAQFGKATNPTCGFSVPVFCFAFRAFLDA
jgi:hypothetical protein